MGYPFGMSREDYIPLLHLQVDKNIVSSLGLRAMP